VGADGSWAVAQVQQASQEQAFTDGSGDVGGCDVVGIRHQTNWQAVVEGSNLVEGVDPVGKGMSQHYICKCCGDLLFKSLSPNFKLLIQNKILDSVLLLDGPLIWITIVHEIFPSAAIIRQTLMHDLLKLNLVQLDNNYAKYLQKLCSNSLLLSPDNHDEQVYMTFLTEMKNHPSAAVYLPFMTKDTSGTFLELVGTEE
jgi:hypothetical protein